MIKKVTCFISTLSDGGAEHQLSILANILSEKGYSVEIVTFVDFEDTYYIHQNIIRKKLAFGKNKFLKLFSIFKYFLFLKKETVVISYLQRCNMLCLLPLFFRKHIKVIVGERNLTTKSNLRETLLFKILYKRANFIVSNSFSQAKYISNKEPSLIPKIKTITNYTDISHYNKQEKNVNNIIRFGIFCRYHKQKNY